MDFERVLHLFNRAESAIKRNERIPLSTPTPAINQLRYAGRHLLNALRDSDEGQLRKAENHCVRAWFDAFDGILLCQLKMIKDFDDTHFPTDAVLRCFPEYKDSIGAIRSAQRLYQKGKMIQKMTPRDVIAYMNAARRLAPIAEKLPLVTKTLWKYKEEQEAQKLEWQEDARRRKEAIAFVATLAGAGDGRRSSAIAFWPRKDDNGVDGRRI